MLIVLKKVVTNAEKTWGISWDTLFRVSSNSQRVGNPRGRVVKVSGDFPASHGTDDTDTRVGWFVSRLPMV